ncbi:hypothetical protein Tco_0164374 [Tanacetum coccineum]
MIDHYCCFLRVPLCRVFVTDCIRVSYREHRWIGLVYNLRSVRLGYAGDFIPLLSAMLAGAAVDQGEGSAQPAEPHHTPVDPISSTSQPPIPSPPHPSQPPHSPHQ